MSGSDNDNSDGKHGTRLKERRGAMRSAHARALSSVNIARYAITGTEVMVTRH